MKLIEDGTLIINVRYSLKVVGTLRVPSTISSRHAPRAVNNLIDAQTFIQLH